MRKSKKSKSFGGNNVLFRYMELDKCLSNTGRKWTWEDLLEKINLAIEINFPGSNGISKTTLFDDLRNMKSIYRDKVEIINIKDGKTSYWTYANPGESIFGHLLNETEVQKLKEAITILSKFKGLPQFDWIHEVIPIIKSKMGLVETGREIISFESNIDYSGAKFIQPLFDAILNSRVLRIVYQSFKNSSPFEVEVHPQYLKQYNSRWFLMSFMDKWKNKPQVHALDRIKEIHETGSISKIPDNFDWDDYFSDMVGVSKEDSEPVEVKLLISDAEQASYIETKPLHQSQKKIKKVESGYETSIKVIPNYELEKLMLSFGERVKIMCPTSLKTKLKERISKAYTNYEQS
jgi:hypothetical protein